MTALCALRLDCKLDERCCYQELRDEQYRVSDIKLAQFSPMILKLSGWFRLICCLPPRVLVRL